MATIVITGANRGIGLELARQYEAAGDTVIRAMRGVDKAHPPFGTTMTLDQTDAGSVATFAAGLDGMAIDLLINNAGVIGPSVQSSTDMDFPGFLATLDANVLGPLRVTQALLPNLRKATAPKIAVISSRMGQLAPQGFGGASGHVAYRASKTAVNKVFQCLAADLAGEGIAVAMLHPGWVRTDMGGPGADIEVSDSAAGIRQVLAGLSAETSGQFMAYNGEVLDW